MTISAPQKSQLRFPRAFMVASRDELSIKLTVRDKAGHEATLPDDLTGHIFIMAFAGTVSSKKVTDCQNAEIVKPGADGLTALFNGDGMVYRIDFQKTTDREPDPGQAWVRSRLIKTPAFFADKLTHENEKYRFLRFINFGIIRLSWMGISNQINTAFQPFKFKHDPFVRLLATNDVNRPYEIDPCTLKILRPIGFNDSWKPAPVITGPFEFLMSSAHPCFDFRRNETRGGEMFTIDVLKSLDNLVHIAELDPVLKIVSRLMDEEQRKYLRNEVYLVQWSQDNPDEPPRSVKQWRVLHDGKPIKIVQSTHMIGLTENYVILADTAMKTEQTERVVLLFDQILEFIVKQIRRIIEVRKSRIGKVLKFVRLSNVILISWLKNSIRAVLAPLRQLLLPEEVRERHRSVERILDAIELLRERREQRLKSLHSIFTSIVDGVVELVLDLLVYWVRRSLVERQDYDTPLYLIRRDQLSDPNVTEISAQKLLVEAPFVHFLTDFEETPDGKITMVAPLTYALDPAEYINEEDRCYFPIYDIQDLTGMIPTGVDISVPSLVVIDPKDGTADPSYTLYPLPKEEAEKYTFTLGLYAYREDMPTSQLQDVFWVGGGGWPELFTRFIRELYKDYTRGTGYQRQISLDKIDSAVKEGVRQTLAKMHIDRSQLGQDEPNPLSIQAADTYTFDPNIDPDCPDNCVVFAVHFVPRKGSTGSDDGYLVCTVVHSDHQCPQSSDSADPNWSNNSEIWIFDAQKLGEGPLYKLSHPQLNFGMTLHSTWLEHIESSPGPTYDVRSDYEPLVQRFIERFPDSDEPDSPRVLVRELFDEVYREFEAYMNS